MNGGGAHLVIEITKKRAICSDCEGSKDGIGSEVRSEQEYIFLTLDTYQ